MEPVYLSWSGGKDSSLALHRLQNSSEFNVTHLLTTVSAEYQRTSMHGVRKALLHAQAESIGLELVEVELPTECSMEDYGRIMAQAMQDAKARGVHQVVFGDIFLADVRKYREERLAEVGMGGVFPLWGERTRDLAEEFIDVGFKARISTVEVKAGLDASFLGRHYDRSLLDALPDGVDPCGERGEFHTFAFDGPIFQHPIRHRLGHVEDRGDDAPYLYQDFLPDT